MAAESGGESRAARAPRYLVVGHITKAHGTRGELFIWPLTDHPDTVFAPGRELLVGDEEGALPENAPSVVIDASRPFKRGVLVKLEGVDSRDATEPLARRYLLLSATAVAPAAEDELFYHELLGMSVQTADGAQVGVVREVFESVPNDLLEVVADDGRARLVPFSARIVQRIDRDAARLVIDPPPGLLDL